MMEILLSLISIFPVSFLAYSLSERAVARHESRVGKQITLPSFIWQTWIDTWLDIRSLRPKRLWAVYFSQLSIVLIYWIDAEYLVFPYLALNGFLLGILSKTQHEVQDRIDSDRKQVSFAVASVIAGLCLLGAFTISQTTNLVQVTWSPSHLAFLIPFQLSGMILFEEHPFSAFMERRSWIESARFYAWTMLATRVFLGGGELFLDFHLKAALVYVFSRLFAIYFPRFRQKDLMRLSILYLFPVTGVVWLVSMLLFALFSGGGGHV
ncbi:hypothetical protein EB061_02340 [bacterium]|jgi:hypothetical protein|nr:hypothetical protein [bacterium]